jgi:site-specific DNA-methyltransferase (adenine-specific)
VDSNESYAALSLKSPKNIPHRINSGAAGNYAVVEADWLDYVRTLTPQSIDLLYVDPPFNTGKRQVGRRGSQASYADSWPSTQDYVAWLRARLAASLPSLKPSANVMLHIDFRICHHARLLLDELLGADRFVNHLIWSYGLGGSSPRTFARKHDDILFYCLDPNLYYFKAPMVPATSRRMAGQMKKSTDVLDIPSLNNQALERTGYPTQKPLKLLDILINAACPPGGTVLDPCCGSGTTLVAAVQSGRMALGCDASHAALQIAAARLTTSM